MTVVSRRVDRQRGWVGQGSVPVGMGLWWQAVGSNTEVGSCHELSLEKGRGVAEDRMIWGQAAPKLRTSLPRVLGSRTRMSNLCPYYLGSLKKLARDLPVLCLR